MGRKLILKRSHSFLSSTPLMKRRVYSVLPAISSSYPHLKGRLPTCSSPVRHSRREASFSLAVRLACLRRAASVRSEPGSNSPSLFSRIAPGLITFRLSPLALLLSLKFISGDFYISACVLLSFLPSACQTAHLRFSRVACNLPLFPLVCQVPPCTFLQLFFHLPLPAGCTP